MYLFLNIHLLSYSMKKFKCNSPNFSISSTLPVLSTNSTNLATPSCPLHTVAFALGISYLITALARSTNFLISNFERLYICAIALVSDLNFIDSLLLSFDMIAFTKSLSERFGSTTNGFSSNILFREAMILSFAKSNLMDLMLDLNSLRVFCSVKKGKIRFLEIRKCLKSFTSPCSNAYFIPHLVLSVLLNRIFFHGITRPCKYEMTAV